MRDDIVTLLRIILHLIIQHIKISFFFYILMYIINMGYKVYFILYCVKA